jgi:hypothetical protein
MHNLSLLEEYYKKYIKSLYYWIPEGIFTVNLTLLQDFDLLHFHRPEHRDPTLTRYFHVIESSEKITLINEEFVVWIMSDRVDMIPVTYTLIAVNRGDQPKLEIAFIASGVYNTSKLILRVLEKFLIDIQETETLIDQLGSTPK